MNAYSPLGRTDGDAKATAGRRYFSLRDKIEVILRYIELGIAFVLPITIALFFSIKPALIIGAIELLSYYIGKFVCEFDAWYNSQPQYFQEEFPESSASLTELEKILRRITYFKNKYYISIESMYVYLDTDTIPFGNNLDWIEMVGLLNQLSLLVGKRFENGDDKGDGI